MDIETGRRGREAPLLKDPHHHVHHAHHVHYHQHSIIIVDNHQIIVLIMDALGKVDTNDHYIVSQRRIQRQLKEEVQIFYALKFPFLHDLLTL